MTADDERIARAFGFTLTRPAMPVAAGALLTLIGVPAGPVGIAAGAGLAAILGSGLVAERRRLARGLAEVEGWGFPVEGYRAWLLATQPTFDLELAREVSIDVIATSAAAIDNTIIVERRDDRVVRIVTRIVEAPLIHKRPHVYVGDRRLLADLRDRVLAPLHADVGIVAMRMGDRDTLATIAPRVAGPGSAFRDQAMAAPPALQGLVRAGFAQLRPANEARALRHHDDRVLSAFGETPAGAGVITLGGLTVAIVVGTLGGPLGAMVAGTATLVGGLAATTARNRMRVAKIAAAVGQYGFPVEGYDDWLISGRPIFDIELANTTDRAWVAQRLVIDPKSISTEHYVGDIREVTWLHDTLVRIEVMPVMHVTSNTAIGACYGGSRFLFAALTHQLLVPLHARCGIVAVRMGGYIDRRK